MNEAVLVPSQITNLFEMGPENNFHSGVSNVDILFVRLQVMIRNSCIITRKL